MVCGFLYFQMFVGMVCHKPCTKASCYSVFTILTVTCYLETEGSSDELLSLLLKPRQLVLYHIVGLYCVYNILWILRTLLTSCIHTYMVTMSIKTSGFLLMVRSVCALEKWGACAVAVLHSGSTVLQ